MKCVWGAAAGNFETGKVESYFNDRVKRCFRP